MASPGSFTSGAVLTATEMNALPGGLLAASQSAGDTTVTTSATDVANVSFTLAATRTVGVMVAAGLADAGGTATFVYNRVLDDDAAGSATAGYYASFYNALPSTTGQGFTNIAFIQLAAGSYTFYWVAEVDAGTIRYNGVSSQAIRNRLVVWDAGA